ncbi:WD40 repeat domain-containing protein [Actinomycetospora aeridis]|uniref:WD40 repeat protein n=1 Tax=Actinomycetospora aeridis TaxID=3129231 RepID=A0ABU8N651_9PSEU
MAGTLVGTYPSERVGRAGTLGVLSENGRRLLTGAGLLALPGGQPAYLPPAGMTAVRLSSDGRYLGLTKEGSSTGYVVDLDASAPTPVPTVTATATGPSVVDLLATALVRPDEQAYAGVRDARPDGTSTAFASSVRRWVALTDRATLTVRDLEGGAVVATAELAQGAGRTGILAVSADGSTVLTGDDEGRVTAFDGNLTGQRVIAQLPKQIREIRLTPDGALAVVLDLLGNVTTLSPRDGLPTVLPGTVGRLDAQGIAEVPVLVPSPDERMLVLGRPSGVEVWSLTENRKLADVAVEPPELSTGADPVLAFSTDGRRFAVRSVSAVHLVDTETLAEVDARAVPTDSSAIAALFTELLGPGVALDRSDRNHIDGRWRSPTGRIEVAGGTVTDLVTGERTPLTGGSGRGSESFWSFADDDTVLVESVVPDRDSDVYQNRLQVWHRGSGALIATMIEPQSVSWPGFQDGGIVVAGGTAITVRPDGGIGRWPVAPSAWAARLCALAGEPSAEEREARMRFLSPEPLCP